jgi:EmrB/QacA subfamily drug resistance transporter
MTDHTKNAEPWWFGLDRKWWTLAVVGAGTFMAALDGSVVNTALPIIHDSTHAPFSTITWVVLVYLLTVSATLLVFGRLGDIYGQKAIYMSGLGIFATGSLFCGLSRAIGVLIAFRAVQALGAAMLMSLGPAVLTGAFPGRERGKALGLQATMTYIGLSTGPALGGLLATHFGWPSIFFINVPIGFTMMLVAYGTMKKTIAKSDQPFDAAGAVTLGFSLALILLGLSMGRQIGWNAWPIKGALVAGIIAAAAFIKIETHLEHPMLDLSMFANRIFAASTAAAFLNYMASSAVGLLMPFYLETASGYPPDKAGLILMSTPAMMVLTTGPCGALSDRIGVRVPATLGMALTATGMLLLRMLQPGASVWQIAPRLALIGLGMGLFTAPNNSAIMGAAPRHRQGVAGAITAAARNIGFAMGVAVSGVIYAGRLATFSHTEARPQAITSAAHDAITVVACFAAIGIVISAVRGQSKG